MGTKAKSTPCPWSDRLTCRAILPRAAPRGFPAHRRPCPYWPLLLSDLGPVVAMAPGTKALSEHRGQRRPQWLQASCGQCHSPWKTGQGPRRCLQRPLLTGQIQVAPLLSAVPLWLVQLLCDANRHPEVHQVVRVLANSQSIQFLPSPPPPESSTVHRDVPSRMQCKQCRRKGPATGPNLGCSGQACALYLERMTECRNGYTRNKHSLLGCPGPSWEKPVGTQSQRERGQFL